MMRFAKCFGAIDLKEMPGFMPFDCFRYLRTSFPFIAMKKNYLFVFLFIIAIKLSAQMPADSSSYPYWQDMMQDFSINYHTTVSAFNRYYENRVVEPHNGFKTFKRWEEFWRTRVDEQGNFPANDAQWNSYFNYFGNGKSSSTLSAGGNWIALGPAILPSNITGQPNGNGRINAIGFHPTDSNKIWAGAPQGGLWSSNDGGVTWTSNTDNLPTLGVSAILIDNTNPAVMYIGTGDRDAGDSQGLGIMKSTDGGSTWVQINSGLGSVTVGMMEMNKKNNNILIVATSGGIFKSINAGATWVKKSPNSNSYKDIEYHPSDTNIVYAVEGSVFYRSTDAGNTFTAISGNGTSNLPLGTRAVIGVSSAAPDYVYVVLANGTYKGTYLSRDKGITFITKSTTPNIFDYSSDGSGTATQAWYDMTMAVDTANFGTIYVGGVNIFRSIDSGATWTCYGQWVGSGAPAIHADQHQLRIDTKTNKLYCGNDGGLYSRKVGASSFTNLTSGLNISQIYRIGQSAQSGSIVIAGWQDNGTGFYRNSISGTNKWKTNMGGDGMECIIDPTDSNYMYGALYYGDIRRTSSGGTLGSTVAASGSFGINEQGAWVTPYALHKKNPNVMFVGYKNIWRGVGVKSSPTWTKITTGFSDNVVAIEQCESDSSRMYYSRSGKFYRTDSLYRATPTFIELTSRTPNPTSTVNWIETHPTKPLTVYILQNGSIYRSNDTGNTWTNLTTSLPSGTRNCLLIDKQATDGLYVGTDVGVFYRDSTMSAWVPYKTNLPANSRITELEMFYDYANTTDCRISASTYGRGLWQSDVYLTNSAPQANFQSDTVACTNRTIALLDVSTGSPDFWQWTITPSTFTFVNGTNTNSQNPQVSFTATGTYSIRFYAKKTGWGYSTLVKNNFINVGSNPPVVVANASATNICKGSSITLLASGANSYTWYGNNVIIGNTASLVVTPSVNTRYVAYGSNGQCLDSAVVIVTVNSVVGMALNTTNITTCEGTPVTLLASGASTYVWSPSTGLNTSNGASVIATPSVTTRYLCTFAALNTCTDTLSVLVNVKPKPPLSVSGDLTICSGSTASLSATGATGYSWYLGTTLLGTNPILSVTPTTLTTYKLKGTLNGCTDSINITVNVVAKPTIVVSGTLILCNGSSTTLLASGTTTYKWYNGSTLIGNNASITLNPTTTTTYKVVGLIGLATCSDSTNIIVTVNNLPTININPNTAKIALGQFTTLTASGASSYTWSPAAGLNTTTGASVVASPTITTVYTVTGKDAANCNNTKTVTVTLAASGVNPAALHPKVVFQPNPAHNLVNITVPNNSKVKLYDITGKLVLEKELASGTTAVEVEKIPRGIYTAEVILGDEKFYSKLVLR